MAYVMPNFKTKKDLISAVAIGAAVRVFSPSPFPAVQNGTEYIEGPHAPKAHTWYAEVVVQDGYVIEVK